MFFKVLILYANIETNLIGPVECPLLTYRCPLYWNFGGLNLFLLLQMNFDLYWEIARLVKYSID